MGRWTDLAPWHGTTHHGAAMTAHRGLVIHIAAGYYDGTISWQSKDLEEMRRKKQSPTSSHWIVGRNAGEAVQMVDTDVQAWAQRGGNATWLSVEMAGFVGDALTAWQVEFCARLLARAHKVYGVPLAIADNPDERGLGHHSMDREWLGEEWGHDACPGPKIIAQKPAIVARAEQIASGEGDDVQLTDTIKFVKQPDVQYYDDHTTVGGMLASTNYYVLQTRNRVLATLAALRAELAAAQGRDPVDEQAVIDGVLAGLGGKDPQTIATALLAALSPEQARQVGALLAAAQG